MTIEKGIFYFFAILLIYAAVRVITIRNPVHAALHLVLAFFASSALWMLMEAEFLSITLVLVYVGAVMVLFLFVVMMLDINIAEVREGFVSYLPVGFLIGLVILLEMGMVVGPEFFGLERYSSPSPHPADYSNTAELGSVLYTVYVYPFEIAAAILLVAIVAAISLTMRRRPEAKKQTPGKQVQVRAADRLRVVKMEASEHVQSGLETAEQKGEEDK
jgi:NADH-quinone oxidoreductase subunit J